MLYNEFDKRCRRHLIMLSMVSIALSLLPIMSFKYTFIDISDKFLSIASIYRPCNDIYTPYIAKENEIIKSGSIRFHEFHAIIALGGMKPRHISIVASGCLQHLGIDYREEGQLRILSACTFVTFSPDDFSCWFRRGGFQTDMRWPHFQ